MVINVGLHLIVDANYELPIGYAVTKASRSDFKGGHALLDEIRQKHPEIMEKAETMMGDRGYDDTKLIKRLWDEDGIKLVIDMREMWQDRHSTRLMEGHTNVTYSEKGQIYCHCPVSGKAREMVHQGFEKDRGTVKKGCPADSTASIAKEGLSARWLPDCGYHWNKIGDALLRLIARRISGGTIIRSERR